MGNSINGERCAGLSRFCKLLLLVYTRFFEESQASQQTDKRDPVHHKQRYKKSQV